MLSFITTLKRCGKASLNIFFNVKKTSVSKSTPCNNKHFLGKLDDENFVFLKDKFLVSN